MISTNIYSTNFSQLPLRKKHCLNYYSQKQQQKNNNGPFLMNSKLHFQFDASFFPLEPAYFPVLLPARMDMDHDVADAGEPLENEFSHLIPDSVGFLNRQLRIHI